MYTVLHSKISYCLGCAALRQTVSQQCCSGFEFANGNMKQNWKTINGALQAEKCTKVWPDVAALAEISLYCRPGFNCENLLAT